MFRLQLASPFLFFCCVFYAILFRNQGLWFWNISSLNNDLLMLLGQHAYMFQDWTSVLTPKAILKKVYTRSNKCKAVDPLLMNSCFFVYLGKCFCFLTEMIGGQISSTSQVSRSPKNGVNDQVNEACDHSCTRLLITEDRWIAAQAVRMWCFGQVMRTRQHEVPLYNKIIMRKQRVPSVV